MLKRLAWLWLLAMTAPTAGAASYGGTATFYAQIHFDDVAWGKSVKTVAAHVGVLTVRAGNGETYWSDVLHVPLQHNAGKFSSWAVLHGARSALGDDARGLMVQYWVAFTDGSSLVTEPFQVKPREWSIFAWGEPAARSAHERLRRQLEQSSIDATQVAVVEEGHDT